MTKPFTASRAQRGITLVEALVAMLIMAFGMVALSGLQTSLRQSSDDARQRTDAMRLAQQRLEALRSYSQVAAPSASQAASGITSYSDIASTASAVTSTINGTTFALSHTVTNIAEPPHKEVTISVQWTNRATEQKTVTLTAKIAPQEPRLAMSTRFAPAFPVSRSPFDRNEAVPTSAKDLGGGISAAAPPGTSYVFWIFDNATGRLTGICNVANRTLGTLTASDVTGCQSGITGGAYVVSGYIRYSTGTSSPNPDAPNSTALPLSVVATLTQAAATAPACYNDSSLAAGAGQTYASYMCAIYPDSSVTPPEWPGRIDLGSLTIAAGGSRVCRYSADYSGDGSINANEHPMTYTNVAASLSRQNFLVIDYSAACPTGSPANPSGGRYINSATAQHQP